MVPDHTEQDTPGAGSSEEYPQSTQVQETAILVQDNVENNENALMVEDTNQEKPEEVSSPNKEDVQEAESETTKLVLESDSKTPAVEQKLSMDLESQKQVNDQDKPLIEKSENEQSPVTWTPVGTTEKSGICDYLRIHFGNKGSISNICSFFIMVIGIILWETSKDSSDTNQPSEVAKYILSMGLFGFAGGLTNWIAVKMLFDKIPFIIGSGVIPRRFKEIRETVKETIMNTFFDPAYLESYVGERAKGMVDQLDIPSMLNKVLASPEVDVAITKSLTEAAQTQEGAVLNMAAGFMGGMEGLTRTIKPMLVNFGNEMGPLLSKHLDMGDMIDINKVRNEIDRLMTEKLKLLTPEIVKTLMEQVIRDHLGWLIVWGNVFGGLIGVIAQAAGFGG